MTMNNDTKTLAADSTSGTPSASVRTPITALLLAVVALCLVAGSAATASAANSCLQGGNVSANCKMDANFVGTLNIGTGVTLDCASFSVSSRGTDNVINIRNARNVTIKNCIIRNGPNGVFIENSRYITLVDNNITGNGNGLIVFDSPNVSLLNGAVSMNRYSGVEVTDSYNITIQGVSVFNNSYVGIYLIHADNTQVTGATISGTGDPSSGSPGIWAINSSYVTISGSYIRNYSGQFGIGVLLGGVGSMVKVQNNTFYNNKVNIENGGSIRSLTTSPNTYF